MQPDKKTRWDYDYVEIGEAHVPNDIDGYALTNFYDDFHPGTDSDEWTIGSSSSISSRTRSPSNGGRSSAEGSSLWEGETIGASSDNEQLR